MKITDISYEKWEAFVSVFNFAFLFPPKCLTLSIKSKKRPTNLSQLVTLETVSSLIGEIPSDAIVEGEHGLAVALDATLDGLGLLVGIRTGDRISVQCALAFPCAIVSHSVKKKTVLHTDVSWRTWSKCVGGGAALEGVALTLHSAIDGSELAKLTRDNTFCDKDDCLALEVAPAAGEAAPVLDGRELELRCAFELLGAARAPLVVHERELTMVCAAERGAPASLPGCVFAAPHWSATLRLDDAGKHTPIRLRAVERTHSSVVALRLAPSVAARARHAVRPGDRLELCTYGAYAQLVRAVCRETASRSRHSRRLFATHMDRSTFWAVVALRLRAAVRREQELAAHERGGGAVHVGYCGSRAALGQLRELIHNERERSHLPIEFFSEVFG